MWQNLTFRACSTSGCFIFIVGGDTRGSQREFFEVYPYILVCPTHIRLARLIVLFFNQQTTLEWFVGVLVLFFCFFCLR